MDLDLLIAGGRVVDPGSGFDGPADVGVSGERVAVVGPDLDPARARRTIDARGLLVTPGLVDLHAHVFAGCGYYGVDPDIFGPRSGVTTFVDAGSAGAWTLRGFRAYAASRTSSRVVAFANICASGLVAPSFELANVDHCDPDVLVAEARTLDGFVRGVKVRLGVPIALSHGLEPLRRARAAADVLGVPLMCHIATAPPAITDVLAELRPGDIVTHAFTGHTMRLTGANGRRADIAAEAQARGIVLDLGHGAGGFTFETAQALADAGIRPDTISTDLHTLSMNGPMFDLPTCLTKMLALGMPLGDVIAAATWRPAGVIGLAGTIGSLRMGALADIALFALERGSFTLADVERRTIAASERLRAVGTVFGGRLVEPRAPTPPPSWIALTAAQRAAWERAGPTTILADELSVEDLGPATPSPGDPQNVLADAYRSFGVPSGQTLSRRELS